MDYILYEMETEEQFLIPLYDHIEEGFISTKTILDFLENTADINILKVKVNEDAFLNKEGIFIVFSEDGDIYEISKISKYEYIALSRDIEGNISDAATADFISLKQSLNLADHALFLKKAILKKEEKSDGSNIDYIVGSYFSFKGLAVKIILISIVISILSMVTPLGFQVFTDKIIPHSAKSSLVTVAVLLIFSAIFTSIFGCYKGYMQSIMNSRYNIKLGKEVKKRLLNTSINYQQKHKAGEITKLVQQVDEVSDFLVMQLLETFTSLIGFIIILPFLLLYNSMLTVIILGIGIIMAVITAISLPFLRIRMQDAYRYDANFQSVEIELIKGLS